MPHSTDAAIAASQEAFRAQIATLIAGLDGRQLDASLNAWLNTEHGVNSDTFRSLKESCKRGIAEGWLCNREGGGIRYGRIFKPAEDLFGFSVDVVDMNDVVGPHHVHPNGEIDLIMPLEGDAKFNGHGAGWLVCPPGSAHHPTVSGGRAIVLYLLPQGAIEFTRQSL
jgi:Domain of unknown function (DUF4863)